MPKGIMGKVARSLWRDLVVPWAISTLCICLFMAMVFAFGLIAWPICFCIFLFVCVNRSGAGNGDQPAIIIPAPAKDPDAWP